MPPDRARTERAHKENRKPSTRDGGRNGEGHGNGRDGERDRCPCSITVYFIPVAGDSTSEVLVLLAGLFVSNPYNRDLYHTALRVQVPEGDECPTYVIELTDYLDEVSEQKERGQVKSGYAGPSWLHALTGPVYGIRKWRDGEIVDGDKAAPNPVQVSTDCDVARRLLDLVSRVPSIDYGSDDFGEAWTSNSVVSWLLQRSGLNPRAVHPPPHGITPGWEDGIRSAIHP